MNKYYIIPDVHGRDFWKSIRNICTPEDEIIFLGDYLDPYTLEEHITPEESIENFKEIVEFANFHPNVTLLIGNHDLPYFFHQYVGTRHIYKYHDEILKIFQSYQRDWKIFYHIPEYNTLLSHAGLCNTWWEAVIKRFDNIRTYEDVNVFFKECYTNHENLNQDHKKFLDALDIYTWHRGGISDFASPLWLDIRDDVSLPDINQYVGHTAVTKPVMKNCVGILYDLDVSRIFVLDLNGIHNADFTDVQDLFFLNVSGNFLNY